MGFSFIENGQLHPLYGKRPSLPVMSDMIFPARRTVIVWALARQYPPTSRARARQSTPRKASLPTAVNDTGLF
jgi:hypothetical protein